MTFVTDNSEQKQALIEQSLIAATVHPRLT